MIPIILKGVKSLKLFCVLHLNNDVIKLLDWLRVTQTLLATVTQVTLK